MSNSQRLDPRARPPKRRSQRIRKPSRRKRRIAQLKQIAQERVDLLFERSLKVVREDPELARQYLDIAKRVRMVARLHLPSKWRYMVCRGCKGLLVVGHNCRVRLQSTKGKGSRVVKTCLQCGHITRYYIKKHTREDSSLEGKL